MKMTIKLNAPGMTSLHKAGLAGLYMTLQAFDETGVKIKGLDWQLEPTQITFEWQDKTPKAALENLIAKAFWLDDEGFIRLTGLETTIAPTRDQKHHLYTALLNSFLQYGKHRKKGGKRALIEEIDDGGSFIKDKNFEPITKFRHQEIVSRKIFVDDDGQFFNQVKVPSWMYPGGIKRHEAHKDTELSEPVESALALLFAPVGVTYYSIKSRSKGRKARLALVIPEIQDLELYAEFRQVIATSEVVEMNASSSSDAALRFISTLIGSRAGEGLAQLSGVKVQCRGMTFGIVSWSEQQKTRTYAYSVLSEKLPDLKNYFSANSIFKNHWQKSKGEKTSKSKQAKTDSYFVAVPTAREFIADNIAQGRVWYQDLAAFLSNKEVRKGLSYERKEMHQMVTEAEFKSETERLFIDVCQESWRRRMGKLSERVSGESEYRRNLIQKEFEKLRISISRSRNAHTLRETVVDLWARAGRNKGLQGDNVQKLLPFFDEKNWRKARDLALLALISYQPTPEQTDLLPPEDEEEGEQ